jgi:hypothetical protein
MIKKVDYCFERGKAENLSLTVYIRFSGNIQSLFFHVSSCETLSLQTPEIKVYKFFLFSLFST